MNTSALVPPTTTAGPKPTPTTTPSPSPQPSNYFPLYDANNDTCAIVKGNIELTFTYTNESSKKVSHSVLSVLAISGR